MAYLTVEEFKLDTVMPDGDVVDLEAQNPGWLARQLEKISAEIDAKLRKRYAAPFSAPYPLKVVGWLEAIVTLRAYQRRGFNPSAMQDQTILEAEKRAWAEIEQAADAEKGLFELPVTQGATATGVVRGGPLGYSEVSPYTWTDRQWEAILGE